jgi:hypothetical protein
MIHYSLLAIVFFAATVARGHSREAQDGPKHCRNPDARYKRVEDYTVKWFQDNILEDILERYTFEERESSAPFSNALFYTRGMSETARRYACNEGLITIWEPWPEELYNSSSDMHNTFSCIHNNNVTRNIFFERMSEAFATKASGFVHVMHAPVDFNNPPKDGIWGRIELRALQSREYVKKISRLKGTNKSTIQDIWEHVSGWIGNFYSTYCSDQPELRRRLRRRSGPAQVPVHEDTEATASHCNLPVYPLHVDW